MVVAVHLPFASASLVVFEPQEAELSEGARANVEFYILSDIPLSEGDLRLESPEGISASFQLPPSSRTDYSQGTLAIVAQPQASKGLHFVNLWIGNEQFVLAVTIIENNEPVPWNYLLLIFAVMAFGIALTMATIRERRQFADLGGASKWVRQK